MKVPVFTHLNSRQYAWQGFLISRQVHLILAYTMDLEIAWEARRILEGLVYPTGYNPVDPPGWLSCRQLEELERLEGCLMQYATIDARSKKKFDPRRLVDELNQLAKMGRGFQVRRR